MSGFLCRARSTGMGQAACHMMLCVVAGPILLLSGCSVPVPPLPTTLPAVVAPSPTPRLVRAPTPTMVSVPSPAATASLQASLQIETPPTYLHLATPSFRSSSTPVVAEEPTDRP